LLKAPGSYPFSARLTYNSWEHLPNLCLRVARDVGARRDAGTVGFSPDERFSLWCFGFIAVCIDPDGLPMFSP
jgi:hypothetical protein